MKLFFFPGGRGEDSSVIITLPEYSAFSDIPEESLAKVLTYLTLIPRWVNQHNTLPPTIHLSSPPSLASFPGNLHLVLVLRPTSFFQRTVTDLGFRFSQEDFMLKMPVVMLSSVTDLLRYIDENQLTSEFGGTLDYCHSDWIVLRTAIESFAVTVKDIAQMLQAFGTKLAETELPDEGTAIVHLLSTHTDKYRKLKEAIWSVSKEGRHLLASLEASGREEDSLWDIRLDWETVQRLLAQLRDMESAFDGFFEKHHLKLQQYLQLLRYEHSFQEVRPTVYVSLSGETLTQTEQTLRDLDSLEAHAQEEMARAQTIILHGHQLAACHHYAMALIVQRCNELRHRCDTVHDIQLVEKFQSKEGAQAALKDIDRFLEGAPSLLSSGHDLLAVEFESVLTPEIQVKHQPVSLIHKQLYGLKRKALCNASHEPSLAEKHVRPIQLVAPRPENPPRSKSPLFSPKHGKRRHNTNEFLWPCHLHSHVMRELIETERVYVEELLSVLLGYRGEMENPGLSGLLPPILQSKKDILFGNMPEIYNFHSRVFLQDLEGCLETPEGVGACFLERKENFQVYECYCQNKSRSESLWRQFSDCAFFQECQKKLEHKLGLDSYLLKPVQRLTKYQLLLKELLKYSPGGCEGTSELQGALAAMLDLLKSVNDSMHQIAITGYQGELSDLGRVLMQGSFSVWISHKKGPTRMKELARFKPMQRHLFLYERALLFCKRREEHGEGADKTPSYSFKHCLKMSAVGITENVKGDVKKFEIWYSGREEVYLVQAPTVEVKMAWLNDLRRILTNQQKLLKGFGCHSHHSPKHSQQRVGLIHLRHPLSGSLFLSDEHCVNNQMPEHIQLSPPLSERYVGCKTQQLPTDGVSVAGSYVTC
uniref:MCF.2 cell line derived transforming sequence a n=1 Tax=Oncorhynchus mykiss TaxID=8022 RepID=A0A8C7UIX4_ONCMY